MANTQSQKPLCSGKPSPSLSLCLFKLLPHSFEQLGEKEDGQHTCVDTIRSRHALPGEAGPAELRLEQSPGCCNQTEILLNWLPGNSSPSRPRLQQRLWPQMPCNSQSISASEKFQVSFSTINPFLQKELLSRTKRNIFATKSCYFFQIILWRKPIVCCDQWNSCCL